MHLTGPASWLACDHFSKDHFLLWLEYRKSGGACPFLAGIRQPSALREEFSLPIATWWLSSEQSFSNYVGLSSRRNFLVTVQGRVSALSIVVISSCRMFGLTLWKRIRSFTTA